MREAVTQTLTGLYTLAFEGTDELASMRYPYGPMFSHDRERMEMIAEGENEINTNAAVMGGPTRPRVVVVELLLPCRVVKG